MSEQPINNECKLLISRKIDERINKLEDELIALTRIRNTYREKSPDWEGGVVFIRASFFKEYAKALIQADTPNWIADNVDIENAANALLADYFLIIFKGVGYWVKK